MPTYELICGACGTRFERFLARLLRDEDRVCPACGSTEVRRGLGGGYALPRATSGDDGGCSPRGRFG